MTSAACGIGPLWIEGDDTPHEICRILDRVSSWTYRVERDLRDVLQYVRKVMADLTQLTADVSAETNADNAAIALLQGLKKQLDAAGTDPVALAALSSSIEANTSALAAAVTANTPASSQPEA